MLIPYERNEVLAQDLLVERGIDGIFRWDKEKLRNPSEADGDVDEKLQRILFFLDISDVVGAAFDIPCPNGIVAADVVIFEKKIRFIIDDDLGSPIRREVEIGEDAAAILGTLLLLRGHLWNFFSFSSFTCVPPEIILNCSL